MNAETPRERLDYLDIFRGIASLTAVGIHVFGALQNQQPKSSSQWAWLAAMNPILLYAVPGFLMLTALLQTRSLLKSFDKGEYVRKRFAGLLIPYFIWSAAYILIAYKFNPKLVTPREVATRLVVGKSYFHLYYLGVAMQLAVIMPFVAPLVRKRPSFQRVEPCLLAATLGFYALNRFLLHLPWVGSIIFWYCPAIALGAWLGSDREKLTERVQNAVKFAFPLALVFLWFYVPLALGAARNQNINTFYFQVSEWGYTSCAALCVLALCIHLQRSIAAPIFRYFGTQSMQMYLAHPLFLNFAVRFVKLPAATPIPIAFLIYAAIAMAGALALAKGIERLGLAKWVFGRV